MSKQSLFDRQLALFRHLTSPELVFGDTKPASSEPSLIGMDLARLRLEAEFSFMKRMEKIRKCLPLTFKHLGDQVPTLSRQFLKSNRPTNFLRYEQAKLFYEFLTERWRQHPPEPEFLPDLVRLEIVIAGILTFRYGPPPPSSRDDQQNAYRFHESAQLVRCRFDLRGLLGKKPAPEPPPRRDVFLLVTMLFDYLFPRVFEIPRALHDRLEDLKDWTLPRAMLKDFDPIERRSIEELHAIGALEYR